MNPFEIFWSHAALTANGLILLNIFGAAGLGVVMGYERVYHGHAAGMRTYGLVCMASAAFTVLGGFPGQWYGGMASGISIVPTQIIQGVVTGIGFLGAGVIMKEGFSIRGLSTAASIWTTSSIGVLIGVGFYAAAILSTLLVLIVMGSFRRLELRLPHRRQMRLSLIYQRDHVPSAEELPKIMRRFGFMILELACESDLATKHFQYDLVLQGDGTHNFNQLIDKMRELDNLAEFRLTPVRD